MSSSPPESPTIATANTSSPTTDKPPTKPRTRSNYHLESNPFEVSFSQPEPTPRGRPPSRDATSDAKPKLPPITAMASPSAAGDFTWAFGHGGSADVNSLRSGPLSPAMLAGPQYASHANHGQNGTHHGVTNGGGAGFDVMRTGLTPDVSRTGLTPLIGGPASFPPPSPNTAAFIAMVTNQNNPNGVAGGIASAAGVAPPATITPGTFSAITGAILNGQNGAGGDSAAAGSSPTASHHAHPLSVSHGPHDADDAAHTAANGLFLLSQAHHELTKREEQQPVSQPQIRAPPSQAARAGGAKGGGRSSNNTNSAPAPATAAGKRKNTSESVAPAAKRARATAARASNSRANAGSRRKKSEEMMSSNEDDEDEEDEMDGEGLSDDEELQAAARVGTVSSKSGGGSKKPETEEEKRKNFLERNRQAALKCRQRKKAWLNQLQAKVEYLTAENERLQNTTVSMREEISRLSAVVVAHRDCGLSGVSVARSEALLAGTADLIAPNRTTVNVAAAPSVTSNVGGGGNSGSGVPSNAPPASSSANGHAPTSNGSSNGSSAMANVNASGMATRRRAAATSSGPGSSPVTAPAPQMVAVGGGGGQGGRYGGY